MNILAIETSTDNFSLAVAKKGDVLASRNVKLNKRLSSAIIPNIERLLDKANIPFSKIDGFAVGLGPGSFTSLRVGLSTIKGLAFVSQKPIVGVSSLDILALNTEADGQICTICDAKRNLVYACLYQKKGQHLKRKSEYLLTDIESVLKKIKGDVIFIGNGVKIFKETIEKYSKRGQYEANYEKESKWYPQSGHLISLASGKFKNKKSNGVARLVPLYLYPQDCQVRR